MNATASWGTDWKPPTQPSKAALAAIPMKPNVKASTKAVVLQHLKVQLGSVCWYHLVYAMATFNICYHVWSLLSKASLLTQFKD